MLKLRPLLCLLALLLPGGATLAATDAPTVGRLLVEIARAKGLPSDSAPSAEGALRSAGFALPSLPPEKPLLEGDVAAIGRALGLPVVTDLPQAPFSDVQVNAFLRVFGPALSGTLPPQGENPPGPYPRPPGAADPATKGKGKKKGLKSPSEPV